MNFGNSLLSTIFLMLYAANGNFPKPLDQETERKLFAQARLGDTAARNTLIEHNLRLVAHIIKKYYSTSKQQEDLMSIGTIGLIKAIDSYKTDAGVRFATYAAKCLQNEILMYFRSQKKNQSEISINETIDVDKDGNPLTYIDIISCDDTIADDIDQKIMQNKALNIISKRLTEREKAVIQMRYGIGTDRPISQREIAAQMGISRSYVSRIEKAALEKINAYLAKPGFYMF